MTALEVRQLPPADIEVLRVLGLDPTKVYSRALMLLAHKYQLDPLIGQIRLISEGAALVPYITRDGMVDIAHRSGKLDGIIIDEERRSTTNDGWTCYVVVWRKDMSHPFKVGAQCRDTELQAKRGYGPEQARARATRRTLKLAFAIKDGEDEVYEYRGDADIEREMVDRDVIEVEEMSSVRASPTDLAADGRAPDVRADDPVPVGFTQSEAHAAIGALPKAQQLDFLAKHKIADFGLQWPPAALEDAAHEAEKPF